MTMSSLRIFGCAGLVLLSYLSIGCRSTGVRSAESGWGNALIMKLPDGWRELESSEVPKSDMQPWWTLNPIVLEGNEARRMAAYFPVVGKPAKVLAVAYMYKDDESTLISMLALQYKSDQRADAQYKKMKRGLELGDLEVAAFGLSRYDEATIFMMVFERPIPERDFFDHYFRHFTRDAYIPPKGGEYVEKKKPKEASKEAWAWSEAYFVPKEKLPEGWRLMVRGELPPDTAFPWWKKNPVVIEREQIEHWGQWRFLRRQEGKLTRATRIASVAYAYGPPEAEDEIRTVPFVQLVVLQYQNAEDAKQEIDELARRDPFQYFRYRGFSLKDKDAIVFMRVQYASATSKEFFEQFFRSVARPASE